VQVKYTVQVSGMNNGAIVTPTHACTATANKECVTNYWST
jgi:hypothetical protein